jgi:amino-acid N-acetyltransferase
MSNNLSQVELIREAFRYQSRFEGSTMVFKIDYPVTEDPGFPYLMKDLALLAQTGFKIVIVPGAKEAIDAVLKQYGIVSAYAATPGTAADMREPVRITAAQALPFVEMAAFHVATRFMTFLSGSRVDAVVGNFVRARGLGIVDGVDMEHTGTVDKIFADSISRVLNLGMVPILPCIGWSPAGKPYNVPSDEIALAVSAALGAVKLFIVSVHGGLRQGLFPLPEQIETRDDGRVVRLTPQEAQAIVAAFTAQNTEGGTAAPMPQVLKELRLALQASRAGVDRVHMIDGREEGAVLKELFSNLGAGTMIYADKYESIRPLHSRDLPDILRLMEPLMQTGILIRRTAEQIQEKKDDYVVFEVDGSVHACGALHDWGEGQGEIAAVATDPLYTGMNLGRRIVSCLIEKARKARMSRVFVLTTQTQNWFESLGLHEAPFDSLPERKRQTYDQSRKSKAFALELR